MFLQCPINGKRDTKSGNGKEKGHPKAPVQAAVAFWVHDVSDGVCNATKQTASSLTPLSMAPTTTATTTATIFIAAITTTIATTAIFFDHKSRADEIKRVATRTYVNNVT